MKSEIKIYRYEDEDHPWIGLTGGMYYKYAAFYGDGKTWEFKMFGMTEKEVIWKVWKELETRLPQ